MIPVLCFTATAKPSIVYVSKTKRAEELADHLTQDGFLAKPYHGGMDRQEKSENR